MPEFKPLAFALPDGRVAVYCGATYSYLPRDKARELMAQVGEALDGADAPSISAHLATLCDMSIAYGDDPNTFTAERAALSAARTAMRVVNRAALGNQRCGACGETIRPDHFTGTTGACATAPDEQTGAPVERVESADDRQALLYLMQQFDSETWQCPQCGHAEDTATMDSADYLRHYLRDHPVAPLEGVIDAKYDDVLVPFARLMAKELHANADKGDRPGWLAMTPAVGMLEIYYHAAKLQKAVKDDNTDGIREYAADVANMAMMMMDVCGSLEVGELHHVEGARVPDVQAMVDRFLGWRLPDKFSPDCYISFNPEPLKQWPGMWPVGTNLLDAEQAKAMFEYVLATPPQPKAADHG